MLPCSADPRAGAQQEWMCDVLQEDICACLEVHAGMLTGAEHSKCPDAVCLTLQGTTSTSIMGMLRLNTTGLAA